MDLGLNGKVAIITGGSDGIGKAAAISLASEGAKVAIVGRTQAKIDAALVDIKVVGGSDVIGIATDVSVESEVQAMVAKVFDEFGGVDILVNNAAIIHGRIPIIEMDTDLWRDVLNVNITGAFLITKKLLPGMIDRHYGKVINISSIGGRKGAAGRSAYRVTKTGLISFTESLAAEVYEHGINVNAICPGGTDTEGYRSAFNTTGRAENPKLMDPREIAEVSLFLASDASSSITGTAIDSFGSSNPLFE